jgi:hypothetical protein
MDSSCEATIVFVGMARIFRLSCRCAIVLLVVAQASLVQALTIGSPQQIGTISSSVLDEVSGLVDSRANAGTFWVHNDSGDSARFYAMSHGGELLGAFPLDGVTARDWEDMAIGPKAGGGNYLYLGDVGDNNAVRQNVAIHRVTEPLSTGGTTIGDNAYTTLQLNYPNGARDVESMFVDPISGELFLITKRVSVPEVYNIPTSAFDNAMQTVTLNALGAFPELPYWATAADISPDGRYILVRSSTPSRGYLYERADGQSVAEALHGEAIEIPLGSEIQGEAIGWAADGLSFFTTSEFSLFSSAPVYSYAFTPPAPALPGDYNDDQRVDAADYTIWRDLFGSSANLPNETETLGQVTVEDYEVWRAHFGQSLGGAGVVAVPEPSVWLLIISSSGLLVGARRGSRSPAAACPGACT